MVGWLVWVSLLFCASADALPLSFLPHVDFNYTCVGNCEGGFSAYTDTAFLLMGGGAGVDEAFRAFADKGGHGDFLTIRVLGLEPGTPDFDSPIDDAQFSAITAFNDYIYGLGVVNSAATLVLLNERAASHPFVLERVKDSEMVWLAGDDQWIFYDEWKFTLLHGALNKHAGSGVPFGGDAAGMMLLGDFVFTGELGDVSSADVLRNPYHSRALVDDGYFDSRIVLPACLTDSHFREQDRMGRVLSFLSKLSADFECQECRALAVSEETAILIEAHRMGTVFGEGGAYVLRVTDLPEHCVEGEPLTVRDVSANRMLAGDRYDFLFWQPDGGISYTLDVVEGSIASSRGDIY